MMSLLETVDWSKAASDLSKVIPREELYPEVVAFLLQNINKPWGISCSGGSDSLALLLLIYGHFPEKRGGLYVFHYNHKLRGVESDGEALFVESCAKSLGLPFILGEGSEVIKNKSEAGLRKNRHQFFSQSLKKINGQILLLGHQRDDVAETMLMRLARGSGTGGLCAPRPVHRFSRQTEKIHLRPLINIGKERLLSALELVGVPWCTDSSNEGESYFRNRIRRNVVPSWVAASTSDLWKGIERSRMLLEEDDEALEYWLGVLFKEVPIVEGVALNIRLLWGFPKALYRRALHRWLEVNGVSSHFAAESFSVLLNNLIESKTFKMSAGGKYFVVLSDGILFLKPLVLESFSFSPVSLVPGSSVPLPQGRLLKAEEVLLTPELKGLIFNGKMDPAREVYLNYDEKNSFFVRLWGSGDRYKPLGSPGTRKLQDMFTDKKISQNERRLLPVVYGQDIGIVWCPGLPIAERFKVQDNTQYGLKLTFE